MKTMLIGVAAAAMAATVIASVPASAQLGIRAGENGVSVRIGDGDRDHHRYRDRHRDRGVYVIDRRDRADCSTTIRTKRPDGTVIVRKRQGC